MGNTNASFKQSYNLKIQNKLDELYSVALDYLIMKNSLTNQIKTQSFMKGYKNERCTSDDDKEECKEGINYKKDATALIKTKTGKSRKQVINNALKYFGYDTTHEFDRSDDFDDFINIDTSEIILEQKLDPLEFQIESLITDIHRLKSNFKHAKKNSIKKVNKKVKSINKLKKKSKAKRGL